MRNPRVRNAGVIAVIAAIVAAGLWIINAGDISKSDGGARTESLRHHR